MGSKICFCIGLRVVPLSEKNTKLQANNNYFAKQTKVH